MWRRLFGSLGPDIGIDLGTANTLVYVRDRGIVINEPSVVAVNLKNDQVLAVGEPARRMVGRTPAHIVAQRPLVSGVISDFEVTERMLRYFLGKVQRDTGSLFGRPRVVIGIPLGVTEVERKAVEDATLNAGAREVLLIEEPVAAAIGARLPIHDASGHMIVDVGGGTAEIAVLSLGGVVSSRSIRAAGQEFDAGIVQYARDHLNLLVGERTAEDVKLQIGAATPIADHLEAKLRGRDLVSGLPREITVTGAQIREALARTVRTIVENIKATIETTPPELVADLYERGILLSGGGALLRGLDQAVHEATAIPVHVADDPLTTVVRGTGIVLEDLEHLRDVLVASPKSAEASLR